MCENKFGLKLHVGLKDVLLEYKKRTKPFLRLKTVTASDYSVLTCVSTIPSTQNKNVKQCYEYTLLTDVYYFEYDPCAKMFKVFK